MNPLALIPGIEGPSEMLLIFFGDPAAFRRKKTA